MKDLCKNFPEQAARAAWEPPVSAGGVDLWKSFHWLSLWQRVNRRRPADVPNETTEAQMRGMGAALSGIRTRVSLLPPAGASDGLVCQAPRKEQWWARGYAPHAPHPGGHVLKHR